MTTTIRIRRSFVRTMTSVFFPLGVALAGVSCKDLVGAAALPAGKIGPETYNTPQGAIGMYRGVKSDFMFLKSYIQQSGALTDELVSWNLGSSVTTIGGQGDPVDERILNSNPPGDLYGTLQQVRGHAVQAIGLLSAYAPDLSPALRGEMYALEGYAEVMLAEFYCSGVPLSTLVFQGDFVYKPSSTQMEVYQHAVALFDSALAISSDSASVMALARVGKGRALLDMDSTAAAAQVVAAVPVEFIYSLPVTWLSECNYEFVSCGSVNDNNGGVGADGNRFAVANGEGLNGLPFVTSNDPRVLSEQTSPAANVFGVPRFIPSKYRAGSTTRIAIASGIEARLIEAEAALHANPNDMTWLTMLNALRTTSTTCTVQTTPCSASAGTGGVSGLPLLVDPGGDAARITLLFTERAYWLFLTGHRQGDLRRLVRNYGRPQNTVYPTGLYFGGVGVYGADVTMPIPDAELTNPLFHGCLNRGA